MSMTTASFLVGTPLASQTRTTRRRSVTTPQALFKKKQKQEAVVEEPKKKGGPFGLNKKQPRSRSKREAELVAEVEKPRKKPSFLSTVTNALDFSAARSKEDEELLYQARAGKGKLSEAQAAALRRKIGGTAKDFWKDWVDVDGEYTESGYVEKPQKVAGLPILIGVVIALFGALAYVVSQTATPPSPPPGV